MLFRSQRRARDIGRIHFGPRKGQGEKHREAPRPGAQIERAAHRPRHPRSHALAQQLGDERARNEDSLVDVEAVLAEPGLADQVGEGLSGAHTSLDQAQHAPLFAGGQLPLRGKLVVRESQRVGEQPRRLVAGIGGAVAEGNARRAQLALDDGEPVGESQDAKSRTSKRW